MPALATAPGASHAAAHPAPPVFASVPTPVGHPGFADRFAGEVGTLALRGIEQAEIVLNPRDLGPVRIELSLNGEAARIAFSAAQPETRHAIEQTLPVLKDLLASNGLMLAGASVSDGRAGQDTAGGSAFARAPTPPAAWTSPGDEGAASPGTVVARSARLRGLVDLYA
ncbi:MAG: flagellar hook-length control protein FliK [Burkholderiaceae bacterium]